VDSGDPARFGITPEALHRYNQTRQAHWPYALSPLSTHDTKRSEDVRARINVLSEIPDEWRQCVERWQALNAPHRQRMDEEEAPDANEEYLLYQTLLGAWPLEPYSAKEFADFVRRIQEYMLKALHEAKVHTSWINPNTAWDEAVKQFIALILDEASGRAFLDDFCAFQRRIAPLGLLNSLAQTLLRITLPGVPDTYQGTELWDFSLVDPDNRRPVDYDLRRRLLGELQQGVTAAGADRRELARDLLASRADGRIKLYLTWQALCCRRQRPGLFTTGEHLPVEVKGPLRDHVFAFVRRHGEELAVVAVPRLLANRKLDGEGLPLGGAVWQGTRLLLAGIDRSVRLHNLFTGEEHVLRETEGKASLAVGDVFAHFPVGLFVIQR
jgi:(1->4)-alpha-D-glucan 1-alpha-D-glucosylmutase